MSICDRIVLDGATKRLADATYDEITQLLYSLIHLYSDVIGELKAEVNQRKLARRIRK